MDEENLAYVQNVVLLSHKEWNYAVYIKVDGTVNHHVEWDKPGSKQPNILYFHSHAE
jgi:hypothetical protein